MFDDCKCKRLVSKTVGENLGVCIGMPEDPDPTEDKFRICLFNGEGAFEINLTPGEIGVLAECLLSLALSAFIYNMAALEIVDREGDINDYLPQGDSR